MRLISANNIFRFHNILMVICWHNLFFVTLAEKKLNLKSLTFFLLKEKNDSTFERARAAYFGNFCKIWVSRNISMLRRVNCTLGRTPYVHTEGTKIANVMHKNHIFRCILAMSQHSQKPVKIVIFSKFFFCEKVRKKSFRMIPIGCSNSFWLIF